MKIATRNLLAELLVAALDDPITATALHCLALAYRAGAQTPTPLTVEQLLEPAPASARAVVGAKLRTIPLLVWNRGKSSEQVILAVAFLNEWQEITTKLARFSRVLQEWSPEKEATPIQQALKKGALLFNHHLFFEVHEVLEAQWMKANGEEKLFLQGLLQIAVAFYHLQNRNLRGALLLLQEGGEKIAPHQPAFLGIELREFLQKLEFCRAELLRLGETGSARFREEGIPPLRFVV